MSVLHLNIPSFAIEVERQLRPRLVGRPVVVAASALSRAPVLCVSSEAHGLGIRKGMSLQQAHGYEPRLTCLLPDSRRCEQAHRKVLQTVSRFTPVYESVRPGSVYLDMGGTELLWGKAPDAASRIRRELWRTLQLDPALGVADNKLISRIAAKLMRPHGFYQVFPGNEAQFLDPLEVELLPGIGQVTSKKLLRELGVRRIGDLAQVPLPLLIQLFGRAGAELSRKARGLDFSEVRTAPRVPALSRTEALAQPSNDDDELLSRLWSLVEALGAELRERRRVAAGGRLEGIYVDRQRTRLHFVVRPPSNSDFVLFRCCRLPWEKFLTRRLRLKSLSLTLSPLQPEFEQMDFTADRRQHRLLGALDALRKKYHPEVVRFGGR